MSPLSDDLPEFSSPDEFEAAIPQEIKDRVDAMTKKELMHRFYHLWSRFLGELGSYATLEERREYFLLKKRYAKIISPH
jgi:hypothetical protein